MLKNNRGGDDGDLSLSAMLRYEAQASTKTVETYVFGRIVSKFDFIICLVPSSYTVRSLHCKEIFEIVMHCYVDKL